MSAEILRRAASLMRERAEAATPGPWVASIDNPHFFRQPSVQAPDQGHDEEWVAECKDARYHGASDAEHIASWHPAVALAVADWLEQHADDHSSYDCNWEPCAALAVARAYLGGAE